MTRHPEQVFSIRIDIETDLAFEREPITLTGWDEGRTKARLDRKIGNAPHPTPSQLADLVVAASLQNEAAGRLVLYIPEYDHFRGVCPGPG